MERGEDTTSAACTSIPYLFVIYVTPPMNTLHSHSAREGETIEGSRTIRNRSYPHCSSAQGTSDPRSPTQSFTAEIFGETWGEST